MKKIINAFATIALVGVAAFVLSGNARAEGDDSFAKTAADGDSMTTIARSIVESQSSAQKISLSNEAKTYAETTIVQTAGAREINVGESVVFKKSLVNDTISSASKLSAQEASAWKPYADLIDFGSTSVAGVSTTSTTAATNSSEETKSADVSTDSNEAKNLIEDATTAATTKSSNWYWWPIGLITLGGLYYILGGKPEKDAE